MRTGVALGSNLGDRVANLRAAQKAIADLAGVTGPVVASPIYETDPVGCEPGAAKFLNAVMEFEYGGDVTELMEKLIGIEESLGRSRSHPRDVSRTIDVDLLYAGDAQIDNEGLQLPHPRLHLRRFVLQPLADVRPELVLSSQTETVRELLARLDDSSKVVRFKMQW
jgi:2-amino-4-hydroxy-6-hydroxymethyldihydropteridine diphosphokinase